MLPRSSRRSGATVTVSATVRDRRRSPGPSPCALRTRATMPAIVVCPSTAICGRRGAAKYTPIRTRPRRRYTATECDDSPVAASTVTKSYARRSTVGVCGHVAVGRSAERGGGRVLADRAHHRSRRALRRDRLQLPERLLATRGRGRRGPLRCSAARVGCAVVVRSATWRRAVRCASLGKVPLHRSSVATVRSAPWSRSCTVFAAAHVALAQDETAEHVLVGIDRAPVRESTGGRRGRSGGRIGRARSRGCSTRSSRSRTRPRATRRRARPRTRPCGPRSPALRGAGSVGRGDAAGRDRLEVGSRSSSRSGSAYSVTLTQSRAPAPGHPHAARGDPAPGTHAPGRPARLPRCPARPPSSCAPRRRRVDRARPRCSSSSQGRRTPSTPTIAAPTDPSRPRRPGPAATLQRSDHGRQGHLAHRVRRPSTCPSTATPTPSTSRPEPRRRTPASARWARTAVGTVAPDKTAPYRTRIVVRYPNDPKHFNGTLLVEWLNVSAGSDTDPNFMYAGTEIVRSGYAWVGVSAQKIGVSGGDGVLADRGHGQPAGSSAPTRPATDRCTIPAISTRSTSSRRSARALRTPETLDPLQGLQPKRVIALGESQSAFELTTYINAIQPIDPDLRRLLRVQPRRRRDPDRRRRHQHGPLGRDPDSRRHRRARVLVRDRDRRSRTCSTSMPANPTHDHLRLWDVAGAAHADAYIVGDDPDVLTTVLGCKGAVNTAPTHYLVAAALDHLEHVGPHRDAAAVGAPHEGRARQGHARSATRRAGHRDRRRTHRGERRARRRALGRRTEGHEDVVLVVRRAPRPFDRATLVRLYRTKADVPGEVPAPRPTRRSRSGYLLPADRAAILAEAAERSSSDRA